MGYSGINLSQRTGLVGCKGYEEAHKTDMYLIVSFFVSQISFWNNSATVREGNKMFVSIYSSI